MERSRSDKKINKEPQYEEKTPLNPAELSDEDIEQFNTIVDALSYIEGYDKELFDRMTDEAKAALENVCAMDYINVSWDNYIKDQEKANKNRRHGKLRSKLGKVAIVAALTIGVVLTAGGLTGKIHLEEMANKGSETLENAIDPAEVNATPETAVTGSTPIASFDSQPDADGNYGALSLDDIPLGIKEGNGDDTNTKAIDDGSNSIIHYSDTGGLGSQTLPCVLYGHAHAQFKSISDGEMKTGDTFNIPMNNGVTYHMTVDNAYCASALGTFYYNDDGTPMLASDAANITSDDAAHGLLSSTQEYNNGDVGVFSNTNDICRQLNIGQGGGLVILQTCFHDYGEQGIGYGNTSYIHGLDANGDPKSGDPNNFARIMVVCHISETTQTTSDNSVITQDYDANGNVTKSVTANHDGTKVQITAGYDSNNMATQQTTTTYNDDGTMQEEVTTSYDDSGAATQQTTTTYNDDGTADGITVYYDTGGEISQFTKTTILNDDSKTTQNYDASGNPLGDMEYIKTPAA